MDTTTTVLLEGLAFPEAPRWRDDRLWFTDQHAHRIATVDLDGRDETVAEMEDRPGGLGWLPDGTLLVVAMTTRRVLRLTGGSLELHADLWEVASFHCNDMVVDDAGRAYVGNFGYDLDAGEPVTEAELVRVDPDGRVEVAAVGVIFPNGSVITPAGELIVGETFAHRLSVFDHHGDGTLGPRRTWAEVGDATPDGICLDAEGCVWIASPFTGQVLHVAPGGEVRHRIDPVGAPYACMLGGPDRRTLLVASSETNDPEEAAARRSGRIEVAAVDVPGAGIP